MVDLSRGEMTELVLKVIPYDKWVGAAEIAAETGIDGRRVGSLIRRSLLGAQVERKPTGLHGRRYLYRRLHYEDKSKHKPASYTEEEWEAVMRLSKEDFDKLMADIPDDTGVEYTLFAHKEEDRHEHTQ